MLVAIPFLFEIYFSRQQDALMDDWRKKSKAVTVSKRVKQKSVLSIEDVPPGPLILGIKSIDVRVALVEGTSPASLSKGPGLIENTVRPGKRGNIAVSGHRTMYGAPFRRLDEITVGDELTLETPGFLLAYKTVEIKQVKPTDTSVLDDFGDNRLTLTTCDPLFSAKFRLIIIGKLSDIRTTGGQN